MHGSKDQDGSNLLKITETLTESTVSRWTSSGIFSQDSIRCSSVKKSKVYCTDWEKHQIISQEEFYSCRGSTTFLVEQKTIKKNVWQMPNSFLCMQKDLEKDSGFTGLGSEKSGTLSKRTFHKEFGTKLQRRCCWEFAESGCPIFRASTPLSRGQLKSKGHGKLSIHFAADEETIETFFRIIVSANQFNLNGAVAEICDVKPFKKEREDPLSWSNRVPHPC